MKNDLEYITVEQSNKINREMLRNITQQPYETNREIMNYQSLVRTWAKATDAERAMFREHIKAN